MAGKQSDATVSFHWKQIKPTSSTIFRFFTLKSWPYFNFAVGCYYTGYCGWPIGHLWNVDQEFFKCSWNKSWCNFRGQYQHNPFYQIGKLMERHNGIEVQVKFSSIYPKIQNRIAYSYFLLVSVLQAQIWLLPGVTLAGTLGRTKGSTGLTIMFTRFSRKLTTVQYPYLRSKL